MAVAGIPRGEGLGRVELLVPESSGADDVIKLRVAGLPTQFSESFCGAGDQDGGVAATAGMDFGGIGMAVDAAHGLNDLADAEALSVTKA